MRTCVRCGQRKSSKAFSPPLLPQEANWPNQVLVIDLVSMPRSAVTGRSLVLTCVDKFSGFLWCYPLESGSANHVAEQLSGHFLLFGPPELLESDAGSNIGKNPHVSDLCDYFGVKTRVSVGYHHEAVGKIERKHLDIKRRLRAISDSHGADWEQRLSGITFSLNNEITSTTGLSPFFVFFLRYPHCSMADLSRAPRNQYSHDYVPEKLRLLSAVFRQAQEQRLRSAESYKRQYDRRHGAREVTLQPGERVWLRNFGARAKMDHPWVGPYTVVSVHGRRHVDLIDRGGRVRRAHVKHLKSARAREVFSLTL